MTSNQIVLILKIAQAHAVAAGNFKIKKNWEIMIIKKYLLLVIFIGSTNAVHGAIGGWEWEVSFGSGGYGYNYNETYRQKIAEENRALAIKARKARALQEKSKAAEEAFYEQLNGKAAWWPDLSDVEKHRRNTLISSLEQKYDISGTIFTEPYSVQQAYTHLLLDFVKQHARGNQRVNIALFNHNIIDLMVDKMLLQPLVDYAYTQLSGGKFSNERSYAQKGILWKYQQFIGTKKPSGHQKEMRATIQTTFHSLLCFWFINALQKKSGTFAQQDSSDFEDACSCCRCW